MFGVKRNVFDDRYHALRARAAEGQAPKAGGVKQQKRNVPCRSGRSEAEVVYWSCDVLSPAESERVRRERPELIIPTRLVRTNKHDGLVDKECLAKSRLVVQVQASVTGAIQARCTYS